MVGEGPRKLNHSTVSRVFLPQISKAVRLSTSCKTFLLGKQTAGLLLNIGQFLAVSRFLSDQIKTSSDSLFPSLGNWNQLGFLMGWLPRMQRRREMGWLICSVQEAWALGTKALLSS